MITSFFKAKPAAGDAAAASSSTTAVASVASGSTKDQKTPAKENERPVAAEGGTKRAGLAASSPQEELVVVEPETSEHSHKRLRKGKAQVVESDDDEQMDESAPAESAAPKRVADVPDSAKAEGGDADGEKADEDGGGEEAEEEEQEEGEEEEEAAGEEGAKAGPSGAARPLKLKQAKAKGAPPKGSTAATIQYHKYDVAGAATWKAGEGVPYLFLARVFGTVEDEPKRLRITELMANAFRTVLAVSPQDLLPVVRLTTNKIAADYAGIELGIGDSIMIKAVAETCGRSVAAIKESLEQEGDLGIVALQSRGKQMMMMKPKPLAVRGVFKVLTEIAMASGKDVQTRKKEKVKQMLVSAQEKEAQYIVRALQGKMRIGASEQTVLVALAHAVALSEAEAAAAAGGAKLQLPKGEALQELLAAAEATVKQAFCELPNLDLIVPALLEHGLASLHEHAKLNAGIPVKPMLAKPTKGLSEVLDRMGQARRHAHL